MPFFKVFLGAHLVLGLALALLVARGAPRPALALVAAPAALATALLALGRGGETVSVVLAPLDLVRVTRETLGLVPLAGWPLAGWAMLWLLLALGLRLAALPGAVRALRGSAPASALAAMALAGWPLGLLFRVSAPEVLPGQLVVNDCRLPRRAVGAAPLRRRRRRRSRRSSRIPRQSRSTTRATRVVR